LIFLNEPEITPYFFLIVPNEEVEVADPAEAPSGPDHMAEYLVRPNAWETSPALSTTGAAGIIYGGLGFCACCTIICKVLNCTICCTSRLKYNQLKKEHNILDSHSMPLE
jgi:hypothetical protein